MDEPVIERKVETHETIEVKRSGWPRSATLVVTLLLLVLAFTAFSLAYGGKHPESRVGRWARMLVPSPPISLASQSLSHAESALRNLGADRDSLIVQLAETRRELVAETSAKDKLASELASLRSERSAQVAAPRRASVSKRAKEKEVVETMRITRPTSGVYRP